MTKNEDAWSDVPCGSELHFLAQLCGILLVPLFVSLRCLLLFSRGQTANNQINYEAENPHYVSALSSFNIVHGGMTVRYSLSYLPLQLIFLSAGWRSVPQGQPVTSEQLFFPVLLIQCYSERRPCDISRGREFCGYINPRRFNLF
jgi:hypothetical protein